MHLPKETTPVEEGITFVDRTLVRGRRQAVAGIERALTGMTVSGYRKVRISPHVAYRDKGVPDPFRPMPG
jgi:FKBP-type peptidyl-prolyl cis-trans isomerase 2